MSPSFSHWLFLSLLLCVNGYPAEDLNDLLGLQDYEIDHFDPFQSVGEGGYPGIYPEDGLGGYPGYETRPQPEFGCNAGNQDLPTIPCRFIPSKGGYFMEHRRMTIDMNCQPVYESYHEPCNLPDGSPSCQKNIVQVQIIPCQYIPQKNGYFITKRHLYYNMNCELQYNDQYEPCQSPCGRQQQQQQKPVQTQPSQGTVIQVRPCQFDPQRNGIFTVQIILRYDEQCRPIYEYHYQPCQSTLPNAGCDRTPRIVSASPCQYIASRGGYFIVKQTMMNNELCQPVYDSIYEPCSGSPATAPPTRCDQQLATIRVVKPCEYIPSKGGFYVTKEIEKLNSQCQPVKEYLHEVCQPQLPVQPPSPVQPCQSGPCTAGLVSQRSCKPCEFRIPQSTFVGGRRKILTIVLTSECTSSSRTDWEECGTCCGRDTFAYSGCQKPGDNGYALIGWNTIGSQGQCSREQSIIPCDVSSSFNHHICHMKTLETMQEDRHEPDRECVNGISFVKQSYYLPNYDLSNEDNCMKYEAVKSETQNCQS